MAYSVEKLRIAGAAKFCRISRQSKNVTRLRLIGDQDVLHRDISPFMYPPSLERTSRLITPRIFPSSVEKEFFNRIGRKRIFNKSRVQRRAKAANLRWLQWGVLRGLDSTEQVTRAQEAWN